MGTDASRTRTQELAALCRPLPATLSYEKFKVAAKVILRDTEMYRGDWASEADREEVYVKLLRFVSLVVETMPRSTGFAQDGSYRSFVAEVNKILQELEDMKPKINRAAQRRMHQPDAAAAPAKRVRREPGVEPAAAAVVDSIPWKDVGPADTGVEKPSDRALLEETEFLQARVTPTARPAPGTARAAPQFDIPDDGDLLAAVAAQESLARRSAAAQASSSGASPAPHAGVPGVPLLQSIASIGPRTAVSSELRSKHSIFPQLHSGVSTASQALPSPAGDDPWASQARYPTLAGPARAKAESARSPGLSDGPGLATPATSSPPPHPPAPHPILGPVPPPAEVEVRQVAPSTAGHGSCSHPPPPPPEPQARPPPPPEQPSEPSVDDRFTALEATKVVGGLRDVHVSVAMLNDFMHIAAQHTRRGIEFCGLLAGTLHPRTGVFTVTTLIIPKQKGSSDQVSAEGEEEVFDVQDKRSLFPLGWVHTHPTQSCFLSSIDIHTQCGYQSMLDESIAIVMAPRDNRQKMGVFRLSTPGGMQLIQKCSERGFHPHPSTGTGQEIYERCQHVFLNPKVSHDVVDLR